MTTASNRLKKIVYDYDLQSGKVDKVSYQHGYDDQFYHLYTYDAENRLTNVQTSADSLNWDNDAFYAYYLHGPLSRSVLGEQQVQGINYAYTLQGWMKGVNPAIASGSGFSIQPDGASGSPIASNAYNLQLNYHYHDFIPISGVTPPDEGINTTMASDSTNLFNGNIASMGVKIAALSHPLLYNYHYDQLNRLVNMDAYNNTGTTWASSSSIQDFKENAAYDPNGNILTYNRNGNQTFAGTGLNMDQLTYYYKPNTNQLDHINDAVSASPHPNDIDAQSSGNYSYDAIGELVGDNASNISNITWTVYGKIKSITKPHQSPSTVDTAISFTYDAGGNRISKTETAGASVTTTWYVRDAHGNALAIYTASPSVKSGDLILSERELYGGSRLGLTQSAVDVAADSVPVVTSLPLLGWGNPGIFVRGNKLFELSNHLGNVLATISDRRYGVSSDGSTIDHFNPVVLDANDYYPFGSLEPGRTYDASGPYRYGFNGQERDDEVAGHGSAYTATFWEYDPRIGRRWNLDPKSPSGISKYSVFANSPLSESDPFGDTLRGIDKTSASRELSIIQNSFPGNDAAALNKLFSLSDDGTTFKSIPRGDFKTAIKDLSQDEQILAVGYFDAINSKAVNQVEVVSRFEPVSAATTAQLAKDAQTYNIKLTGTGQDIDNLAGGGFDLPQPDQGGSYTAILTDSRANIDDYRQNFRGLTTNHTFLLSSPLQSSPGELSAHEMLGHGLGGQYNSATYGHKDALQMTNLYRRVHGQGFDPYSIPWRNGTSHGTQVQLDYNTANDVPDYLLHDLMNLEPIKDKDIPKPFKRT